ncbi:unnamed protein product [Paramecium sonneborni]|uniref:Uncharacterized protein n=1 Tax=Paramecium sonneborni TaxID=65129 RepID=A0A8S1QPU9_9CILI|nr:unnamed protein product [Paramecium sonneborni]
MDQVILINLHLILHKNQIMLKHQKIKFQLSLKQIK